MSREVDRDATGAAADVEDGHVGFEVGEDVGDGVAEGAPAVGLEDRGGVVSCVGCHCWLDVCMYVVLV